MSFVALNMRFCATSGSPSPIPVAQPATNCVPAVLFTLWLAPMAKTGGSLTGVTVIVTIARAESDWPSAAKNAKLSGPLKFAFGV